MSEHKDKIGFVVCLAHEGEGKPMTFCARRDECQRNLAIRHHQVSDDTQVTTRMCSEDYEYFKEATPCNN